MKNNAIRTPLGRTATCAVVLLSLAARPRASRRTDIAASDANAGPTTRPASITSTSLMRACSCA